MEYETMYGSGSDEILGSVRTATQCQFECQKRPYCKFFMYDSRYDYCGMKTMKDPVYGATFYATSGPTFCVTKKGLLKFLLVYN